MKAELKLLKNLKGATSVMTSVIEVAVVVTVLPVIATIIAGATNLSTAEKAILGLVTLVITLGLVVGIVKSSGLGNKV